MVHADGFISYLRAVGGAWQEAANVGIANIGGSDLYAGAPNDAGNLNYSNVSGIFTDFDNTGRTVVTSNTLNLAVHGDAISWDAAFNLPYDAGVGGYQFNLYASADSSAEAYGDAIADFSNTFRLTAVTQADGSALTGPITFDSGFQLRSVPEPGSLVGGGTGFLLALAYVRRRRARGDCRAGGGVDCRP